MSITKIRVAATADDMQSVFAIRAAVYMSEQECPYDEEFDGNDYSASHLLALVDGRPAGILRIRYFASFAKIERLAVLPRYRNAKVASGIIRFAVQLCRRKGYTSLYAHAQKRLLGFWQQFGFLPLFRNSALVFSDHEYVEIGADIAPHDDPITRSSNPYLILRPEGRWDETGILEMSSARPATNPH